MTPAAAALLAASLLAGDLCDPVLVHIAMTLDMAYLRGSLAAVLSIVQHTACPENVALHFVAEEGGQAELAALVAAVFPYLRFRVYRLDGRRLAGRISASVREALQQPLNYARMYIPDLLPACLRRVVYLDSDVLVLDDVRRLWGVDLRRRPLAAPEYCHANFTHYFTPAFWRDAALRSVFHGRAACYFNTGVMVMDLEQWRRGGYSRLLELWMELQKARRIYELGSLPPFLLAFAGRVEPVDHSWNQHGLGGDNLEGRCRPLHPGPVSLLHWSGKGKPWMRLDAGSPCPLDSLWAPYDLLLPSISQARPARLAPTIDRVIVPT